MPADRSHESETDARTSISRPSTPTSRSITRTSSPMARPSTPRRKPPSKSNAPPYPMFLSPTRTPGRPGKEPVIRYIGRQIEFLQPGEAEKTEARRIMLGMPLVPDRHERSGAVGETMKFYMRLLRNNELYSPNKMDDYMKCTLENRCLQLPTGFEYHSRGNPDVHALDPPEYPNVILFNEYYTATNGEWLVRNGIMLSNIVEMKPALFEPGAQPFKNREYFQWDISLLFEIDGYGRKFQEINYKCHCTSITRYILALEVYRLVEDYYRENYKLQGLGAKPFDDRRRLIRLEKTERNKLLRWDVWKVVLE